MSLFRLLLALVLATLPHFQVCAAERHAQIETDDQAAYVGYFEWVYQATFSDAEQRGLLRWLAEDQARGGGDARARIMQYYDLQRMTDYDDERTRMLRFSEEWPKLVSRLPADKVAQSLFSAYKRNHRILSDRGLPLSDEVVDAKARYLIHMIANAGDARQIDLPKIRQRLVVGYGRLSPAEQRQTLTCLGEWYELVAQWPTMVKAERDVLIKQWRPAAREFLREPDERIWFYR